MHSFKISFAVTKMMVGKTCLAMLPNIKKKIFQKKVLQSNNIQIKSNVSGICQISSAPKLKFFAIKCIFKGP